MPRSPMIAVFAALLTAALAATPRAFAASPALEGERRLLQQDRDPDAANAYLDDVALQARINAEQPAAAVEFFRTATELRDLRQLLRGYEQEDRVIREGLDARPDCSFCQDPKRLLAWSDRYHAASREFLRGALYEWDTLKPSRAKWLTAHGATRSNWDVMTFTAREKKLSEYGKLIYDRLMKADPKNMTELEAMNALASEVDDVLDHDTGYALDERMKRAETSIKGLAQAEKRLAASSNPELLAALKAARNAPDMETRLANLAKIFDGLNIADPVLRASAPLKPGQGFDDATRRLTADMLGPLLLHETDGTWAGADLRAFYATTPMKITLEPEGSGNLATYTDGVLNFGAGEIEEYLKGRNRSAHDLLTDSALMHDLIRELAPVFVHEATHHRQDVWAKSKGIDGSWTQYQEIEAMETESLFILEKMQRDSTYKAYLAKSANSSTNARETLGLANRLETEGPDLFRRSIQALHYPGLISLEGEVWSRIVKRNKTGADVRAELARRQGPVTGPALKEEYDTRDEFLTALKIAGTDELQAFLAEETAKDRGEPEAYALHHAHLEDVNRLTAERLASLAKNPAPKPGRTNVPPPSKRNL
jgi:hypothetical protein